MDRRKFITSGTSACAGFSVYGSRAYAASERSAEPYTAAPDGNKILKLNHNANPLGMPPGARAAVLEALEETGEIEVRIVLDPAWSPDRMTDDARDQLGIF